MIFKPRKQLKMEIIMAYCAQVVLWIMVVSGLLGESGMLGDTLENQIMIVCTLSVLCIIAFTSSAYRWISGGRTIIMKKEGCAVSFGKYQREYKWEDFKIKAVEDFSRTYWGLTAYKKAAIFSPRYIYKPWWWPPSTYALYLHPFSFIYIYFTPEKKDPRNFTDYEVDEKEFLEKMKEWGIELDEISFYDGVKWKKESKKNRIREKRNKSS